MNKLKVTIAGLLIACLGVGVINAQDKTATAPAKKSAPKAKTAAAPAAKTDAKPAQHLKKDGTPDMRYKENKAAKPATTTTPAKKGTTPPKKGAPQKAATTGGNKTM